MIPQEYLDLIEKLIEKTEHKLVEWKTTPTENEFSVAFKDFTLTLYKGLSVGSDNAFVRINIIKYHYYCIHSACIPTTFVIHFNLL